MLSEGREQFGKVKFRMNLVVLLTSALLMSNFVYCVTVGLETLKRYYNFDSFTLRDFIYDI